MPNRLTSRNRRGVSRARDLAGVLIDRLEDEVISVGEDVNNIVGYFLYDHYDDS